VQFRHEDINGPTLADMPSCLPDTLYFRFCKGKSSVLSIAEIFYSGEPGVRKKNKNLKVLIASMIL
jgi:hypothetical protein